MPIEVASRVAAWTVLIIMEEADLQYIPNVKIIRQQEVPAD